MNRLILLTTSILALSQAATIVPTDSSSVNVKQSGKDYSYSIHQTHAVAVDPSQASHQVPIAKSTQVFTSGAHSLIAKLSQQDQILQQQQITQNRLSEKVKTETNKPQEQGNVIGYPVPTLENQLQPLPSNILYILPYNFGQHYPQYYIRYV